MKKKVLSIILALVMVVGMIPFAAIPAMAEEQQYPIKITGDATYSDMTIDMSGKTVEHVFEITGDGKVTFQNITFINVSGTGDGSCVYINGSDVEVTFNNCRFINCSAADEGGAVYIENVTDGQEVIFDKCYAVNCRAGVDGGFMYVNDAGVYVYGKGNTVISGCTAGENGGAIYMDLGKKIDGFLLSDNTATEGNGGGICNTSDSAVISNCRFYRNKSGKLGGGMYTDEATVENCKFFENDGSGGGYSLNTNDDDTQINSCTFTSSYGENAVNRGAKNKCSFPAAADYKLSEGDGSQENPYVINNIDDWDAMYCMVYSHSRTQYSDGRSGEFGTDAFKGKYVRLDADILVCNTIGKAEYDVQVGNLTYTAKREFTGTFDGNGHTVTYIDCRSNSEKAAFGYANGATVKNLTVNGYIKGNWTLGGIFGNAWYCTAENCVNNAEIHGSAPYAGGIAAYSAYTNIINCTNNGKVESSEQQVGGIAGYAEGGAINDCVNNGEVFTGYQTAGGIAGYAVDCDFDRCTNSGTVTAMYDRAGGFVGSVGENSSIFNCINHGNVSGRNYVGGIIGCEEAPVSVKNCIVTGSVSAVYDTATHDVYPLEGDYKIFTALDDHRMCLEIEGNSTAEGANLRLYEDQYTNADIFTIERDTTYNSFYNIRPKNSGLYLAPDGAHNSEEVINVTQRGKNYHQLPENASWSFELSSDGYYYIRNENKTLSYYRYLNVANGIASSGINVITFRFTGETNEKFRLVRLDGQLPVQDGSDAITGYTVQGSTYEHCFYNKEKTVGSSFGTGLSTNAMNGISADAGVGKMPEVVNDYVADKSYFANGWMRSYFDNNNQLRFTVPMKNDALIWGEEGKTVFYTVTQNMTLNERVTVLGDVKLYLNSGCTITANAGITLENENILSVYGASNGTLTTNTAHLNNVAIGGRRGEDGTKSQFPYEASGKPATNCGTLKIYSGNVYAKGMVGFGSDRGGNGSNGDSFGSIIGSVIGNGGNGGNGGSLWVYGGNLELEGTVKATGGGIGGKTGGYGRSDGADGKDTKIEYAGENIIAEIGGLQPWGTHLKWLWTICCLSTETDFGSASHVKIHEHSHNYRNIYEWSADNSTCTAKQVCDCPEEMQGHFGKTQTVNTTWVHTAKTCTEDETTKYTAVFESPFENQVKSIYGEAAPGHSRKGDCKWNGESQVYSVTESCDHCDYTESYTFAPYDYLAAENGAYIDTGYKPTEKTRVVMNVHVNGTREYWFGVWDENWNRKVFALGNDNTEIYAGYGNQGGGLGQNTFVPNGYHTVELDKGTVKIDSVEKITHNAEGFPLKNTLYLFAQNRNGQTFINDDQSTIHCYGCEIYEGDTLVRKFVPGKKNDGTAGLLDVVSGVFYGNNGNAAMTAQNDSDVQTIAKKDSTCSENGHTVYYKRGFSYYSDKDCTNRITDLFVWLSTPVANGGGLLPTIAHDCECTASYDKSAGVYIVTEHCKNCDYTKEYSFTEYDYIAAEKGAYINTGYKPTGDTRVVMNVYVNGAKEYWFGMWDIEYNRSAFAFGNDKTGIYTGYGDEGGTYGQVVSEGYHTIELDKNLVKVDGNLINTHNAAEFKLNNNLYLFAQNRKGNAVTHGEQNTIHCYGCEIYEGDTLVRKFVPCKNENGASGLLDIVNGLFYANNGSASMTAKNDEVQTINEQAATCTENGHSAYYKRGFKYYTNEACTNEITDLESWLDTTVANGGGMIPALGHSWEYLDTQKHKCSVCKAEEAHTDDGDGCCAECGASVYTVTLVNTETSETVYSGNIDCTNGCIIESIANGTYLMTVSCAGMVARTYPIEVTDGRVDETVTISIEGDVNGDGEITVEDYSAAVNAALASENAVPEDLTATADYQKAVADLDKDGFVDVLDIALLERKINI